MQRSRCFGAFISLLLSIAPGCSAVTHENAEGPEDGIAEDEDALKGAPTTFQGLRMVDKGTDIKASFPQGTVLLVSPVAAVPIYVRSTKAIAKFSTSVQVLSGAGFSRTTLRRRCSGTTLKPNTTCGIDVIPPNGASGAGVVRVTMTGTVRDTPDGPARQVSTSVDLNLQGTELTSFGAAIVWPLPNPKWRIRAPWPETGCLERTVESNFDRRLKVTRCGRGVDWSQAQDIFVETVNRNGSTYYKLWNEFPCAGRVYLTHRRPNGWLPGQNESVSWEPASNWDAIDQLWIPIATGEPSNGYRLNAFETTQVLARSPSGDVRLTRYDLKTDQTWLIDDGLVPMPGDGPDLGEVPVQDLNNYFRIRGVGSDQGCLAQGGPTNNDMTEGSIQTAPCIPGSLSNPTESWVLLRTNDGQNDAQFKVRAPRFLTDNMWRVLSIQYTTPDRCERLKKRFPDATRWSPDEYAGAPNETAQWRFVRDPKGYYRIQSVYSGLFLRRWSDGGTTMVPYSADDTQLWSMEAVQMGRYWGCDDPPELGVVCVEERIPHP